LLVTTRAGLLVAVVPRVAAASVDPAMGASGARAEQEAASAARAVVGRAEEALQREAGLQWRIGVSRPRTGGTGVQAGFTEASRAVELADALAWPDRVVEASTLLIYEVLARDAEAMRELIAATLLPLKDARGGAEPLLGTLRAYFAAGGVATAAARSLHLSVRALTYRLERIATLTGRDPTDPEDRFTLQAATMGQQLLGWP
jgi:DNA-binding PucR family transcriptional regulator